MFVSAARRALVLLSALMLATGARTESSAPRLDKLTTMGLNDLQATVTVVQADQAQLEKINRDFGMAYKLRNVVMRYKEPNKLRMDGKIGCLIFNGSTRFFRVPQLKYSRKDELGNAPGKRHSLLDIGLLTRSGVSAMQSTYVRDETLDSVAMQVFDVSYRGDDTAHYRLWIDPRTRVVAKREWYDAQDKLRATFYYKDAREVKPGLWVPTRLEIRTGDGDVAGITAYTDLKINQGLDDTLFQVS